MVQPTSALGILPFALAASMLACQNPGPEPPDAPPPQATFATGRPQADNSASPASAPRHKPGRTCSGTGEVPEGACTRSAPGVYAMELQLDVWWRDEDDGEQPAFDPGRGRIQVLSRLELGEFCQDGSADFVVQTCGVRFPALYAANSGGVMQFVLPDALWERGSMPTPGNRAHARGLGAEQALKFEPVVSLFGLEQAADATWPAYSETPFVACADGRIGAQCFADQDADREPGISLELQLSGEPASPAYERAGGFQYTTAPTKPGAQAQADGASTLYVALRTELELSPISGDDCQIGSGSVRASDLLLRVLDCSRPDGSRCSPAEATYVDRHVPAFHALAERQTPPSSFRHGDSHIDASLDRSPSHGTLTRAVWLAASADELGCAEVRAALQP